MSSRTDTLRGTPRFVNRQPGRFLLIPVQRIRKSLIPSLGAIPERLGGVFPDRFLRVEADPDRGRQAALVELPDLFHGDVGPSQTNRVDVAGRDAGQGSHRNWRGGGLGRYGHSGGSGRGIQWAAQPSG